MTRSFYSPEYQKFKKILIKTREEQGLTQEVLAERLDIYQPHISRVENGERRLDVVEFIKYAKALNQNPIKFFEEIFEELG